MTFWEFVICAIAGWRLASMLVVEMGPFDMFERVRHFVGVRYNNEHPVPQVGTLPTLFSCIWCLSVWTGTIAYIVWQYWEPPVVVMAISGVAVMIEQAVMRR